MGVCSDTIQAIIYGIVQGIGEFLPISKDWVNLIAAGFTKPKKKDGKLFWFLVMATIPGAMFGVLLDKYMGIFRNPALIGVMLIVMGIILYAADKYGKSEIDIKETGFKRSLIIGLAQVFAIIPGVSRSGVTMTVGRTLRMTVRVLQDSHFYYQHQSS